MSPLGSDAFGPSPLIAYVLGVDQLAWRPAGTRLLDAVDEAATANGLGLMLVVDATRPSQALRACIADGRISGVLIRAQAAENPWVRELVHSVPTVMIGAHAKVSDVHVVEFENVESTAALVGSMLDAGCERLAMVLGKAGRIDAESRAEGFRLAHVQRGLTVDPALIYPGDFFRETAYAVADAILDAEADGIFAANDEMARGLMERIEQCGISVPKDLMIAGFDGTGTVNVTGPELATVRVPWRDLADIAVETLLGLMGGMDMPRERLVDPEVSLGETIVAKEA